MLTTRQYLRQLDSVQLRKLFDKCDFTDVEYKLMVYTYIQRRYVVNICDRLLFVSQKQYHNMLNIALTKVECKLKELDKVRYPF